MNKEQMVQVIHDDRTGAAAAASTIAASLATMFDWIPGNIGGFGIFVGSILSITLIVINIRGEIRKTRLDNLEIKRREQELENDNDD